MNKLVFGVGVNDLGYRTQVKEYVTEDGGRRIRKPVFICKYYAVWRDMLTRCYSNKSLESYPTYIGQYRDWETDRKSTRLNSSHSAKSRMPSSA